MTSDPRDAIRARLAALESQRQASFEHTWAVSLAVKLGVPRNTLAADFNLLSLSRLVSLPLQLFAENVPETHIIQPVALQSFTEFQRTSVWKAYQEGIERRDIVDTVCCGLITRWAGLPTMVLHDWVFDYETVSPAKSIGFVRWHTSKFGRQQVFTLMSVDDLATVLVRDGYVP